MKTKINSSPPHATRGFTQLAIALAVGVGVSHAQTIEVGGAGTIGDTVLTTTAGVARLPGVGANWTAAGGIGNTFSYLESPTVSVTATGNVTLSFTHRHNFEDTWDGGAVFVSVDGGAFAKVPLSSFTANGYNGTAQASVWPVDEEIFTGQSTDYGVPTLITSTADLGTLNAGQTVAVEFRGGWDSVNSPAAPNWEIGTVTISDTGGALLDVDFTTDGTSGFTASADGTASSPWQYNATSVIRFELDAATDTADRFAPDIAGSSIDLAGVNIQVALLNGTFASGDVFSLFDLSGGTTLTGSIGSISLPPNSGIWDTSSLATAGTIIITQAFTPADGTWIVNGDGNWIDEVNWDNDTIAYGTDRTASFTADITANRTVTLGADLVIGNVTKSDATPSNHSLTIGGTNSLTFATTTGTPTITNTDSVFAQRRLVFNAPIAGTQGFVFAGGGMIQLGSGSTNYTGATTITESSFVDFAGISNANIGGGAAAGRNITVEAGSTVRFNALSNDYLNRIAETDDVIYIITGPVGATGTNTNDLDFSSSAGADLPNGFLASWSNNNAPTRYYGTITPASDNYRLGAPYSPTAQAFQIGGDLTGSQGLIVGGGTVMLSGSGSDFSGETVVLTGGRLAIARLEALKNSALNTDTGSLTFLADTGGNLPDRDLVNAPVLGGLIGSRNLSAMYNTGTLNNVGQVTAANVLGITLNPGTGKTHTYSGNVAINSTMLLTKTGDGTQILSGANTFTGATTIEVGTLAFNGGGMASPITVEDGASIGFTLGSTTTSTSTVDLTDGTVKIIGSVDGVSDYHLMTASSFSDTPTLDAPITDYVLQLQGGGTELWLVNTAGGTPYSIWSGGSAFSDDDNGDGVSNGLAFLLGAGDPDANALGLLPVVDENSGGLVLTFSMRNAANRGLSTLDVQWSNDLGITDAWTTNTAQVPETSSTVNDVVFVITPNGTLNGVVATIPLTKAAGGKLFGRLSGEEN